MGLSIVTGANRGIGLELVRQLSARGATVVAVCRQPSAALKQLGVRVETDVDVSDAKSVHGLAERLAGQSIELLINNAGILKSDDLTRLEPEGVLSQFSVNALGPLLVTAALLPGLSSGSKVAMITSRMGSLSDNSSGSMYGYRMSKAALNAAAVSLALDLKPRGVAVAILHPGFVRTEMTQNNGMVDPSESAAGLLARIDELTLERSGEFRHMNGEALPW